MDTFELITWKLKPLSCFSIFLTGRNLSKNGGRNFGRAGLASAAGGSSFAFAGSATDEATGVAIGVSVGLISAAAGTGVEGAAVVTGGSTAGFTSSADEAGNKKRAPLRVITRSRDVVFMVECSVLNGTYGILRLFDALYTNRNEIFVMSILCLRISHVQVSITTWKGDKTRGGVDSVGKMLMIIGRGISHCFFLLLQFGVAQDDSGRTQRILCPDRFQLELPGVQIGVG